jgi:SAM-dependent methyltransferase
MFKPLDEGHQSDMRVRPGFVSTVDLLEAVRTAQCAALIAPYVLNQPMLDIAAARQPRESRIEWRQADALALPFEDESFDAVVCQFGVMFFPDKIQGYREARRVLKAGGRFFFNVWDKISENEFIDVIIKAVATLFPQDPPQFMARIPYGYYNVEEIGEQLTAAGFASISTETLDATSRALSPRDPAIAYCQAGPLRSEIEARDPSRLEEATQRSAEALAQRFGSEAIEGRIRAHVITAIR